MRDDGPFGASDLEPFDPRPRRGGIGTARLAGTLAIVLIVLVAVAALASGAVRLPSLVLGPTGSPTSPPSPTVSSSPEPSTSVAPSFIRPTPTTAPAFVVHIVGRGDSLTSIARTYGTTGRSIAYWNRDTYPSLDPDSAGYDPNRIDIGWRLRLQPGVIVDPSTLPTATPDGSSPPSVAPSPTANGSPSAFPTAPAAAISHGSRSSARIALTFDMGGRVDPALDIMEWLVDHEVRATIFPTGETGTGTSIGRAVLRAAADRPDLFSIGNHSWSHPDFRTLTAAQMGDQLNRTEDAVGSLIGRSTRPWFRPPYGGWNDAVRTGVGAAGWGRLVTWDVDTIDWRPTTEGGPTASDIVTRVLSQAQNGSIVLLHLGGYHTLEALPGIVDGLRARGFTLVRLDDLPL